MQDAKNDISDEAADDAADDDDDEDEDEVIETKLAELSELMARITDEVEAFAQLEKQRKTAAMADPLAALVSGGRSVGIGVRGQASADKKAAP